jgi:hypothetical protein
VFRTEFTRLGQKNSIASVMLKLFISSSPSFVGVSDYIFSGSLLFRARGYFVGARLLYLVSEPSNDSSLAWLLIAYTGSSSSRNFIPTYIVCHGEYLLAYRQVDIFEHRSTIIVLFN